MTAILAFIYASLAKLTMVEVALAFYMIFIGYQVKQLQKLVTNGLHSKVHETAEIISELNGKLEVLLDLKKKEK